MRARTALCGVAAGVSASAAAGTALFAATLAPDAGAWTPFPLLPTLCGVLLATVAVVAGGFASARWGGGGDAWSGAGRGALAGLLAGAVIYAFVGGSVAEVLALGRFLDAVPEGPLDEDQLARDSYHVGVRMFAYPFLVLAVLQLGGAVLGAVGGRLAGHERDARPSGALGHAGDAVWAVVALMVLASCALGLFVFPISAALLHHAFVERILDAATPSSLDHALLVLPSLATLAVSIVAVLLLGWGLGGNAHHRELVPRLTTAGFLAGAGVLCLFSVFGAVLAADGEPAWGWLALGHLGQVAALVYIAVRAWKQPSPGEGEPGALVVTYADARTLGLLVAALVVPLALVVTSASAFTGGSAALSPLLDARSGAAGLSGSAAPHVAALYLLHAKVAGASMAFFGTVVTALGALSVWSRSQDATLGPDGEPERYRSHWSTPIYRVFPVAWVVLFGSAMLPFHVRGGPLWQSGVEPLMLAIVLFSAILMSPLVLKLRSIEADREGLFVWTWTRRVRVPYASVEWVYELPFTQPRLLWLRYVHPETGRPTGLLAIPPLSYETLADALFGESRMATFIRVQIEATRPTEDRGVKSSRYGPLIAMALTWSVVLSIVVWNAPDPPFTRRPTVIVEDGEEKRALVYAARDLAPMKPITEADLFVQYVPPAFIPETTFTRREDVAGRIPSQLILAGAPVRSEHVFEPTPGDPSRHPWGGRAVYVKPVDPEPLRHLQAYAFVDLWAVDASAPSTAPCLIAEDVYVFETPSGPSEHVDGALLYLSDEASALVDLYGSDVHVVGRLDGYSGPSEGETGLADPPPRPARCGPLPVEGAP